MSEILRLVAVITGKAVLFLGVGGVLGLSAIVGAFIAGASLGGLQLRHGKDLRIGSEYLQIIFASIFFVSLGILADVRGAALGQQSQGFSDHRLRHVSPRGSGNDHL